VSCAATLLPAVQVPEVRHVGGDPRDEQRGGPVVCGARGGCDARERGGWLRLGGHGGRRCAACATRIVREVAAAVVQSQRHVGQAAVGIDFGEGDRLAGDGQQPHRLGDDGRGDQLRQVSLAPGLPARPRRDEVRHAGVPPDRFASLVLERFGHEVIPQRQFLGRRALQRREPREIHEHLAPPRRQVVWQVFPGIHARQGVPDLTREIRRKPGGHGRTQRRGDLHGGPVGVVELRPARARARASGRRGRSGARWR
jgi:hypothetical protein